MRLRIPAADQRSELSSVCRAAPALNAYPPARLKLRADQRCERCPSRLFLGTSLGRRRSQPLAAAIFGAGRTPSAAHHRARMRCPLMPLAAFESMRLVRALPGCLEAAASARRRRRAGARPLPQGALLTPQRGADYFVGAALPLVPVSTFESMLDLSAPPTLLNASAALGQSGRSQLFEIAPRAASEPLGAGFGASTLRTPVAADDAVSQSVPGMTLGALK